MIRISPASVPTAWRGGSASGSRPARSAASSASTASRGDSAATAAASRKGMPPPRSPQHEPGAERVAGVEDEAVLAGAVGGATTSTTTASRPSSRTTSLTVAANAVPTIESWREDATGREAAVGVQQRDPRAGARPARRAVDLAVGEDGHVALVRPGRGVAEVVEDDRPVDAGEAGRRSDGGRARCPRARALISRPSAISSP